MIDTQLVRPRRAAAAARTYEDKSHAEPPAVVNAERYPGKLGPAALSARTGN